MKKYRCPHCQQIFTGTPEKCPTCGVTLRYTNKEKPRKQEEATVMSNFSFNDPDVVKHDDKVLPVTSVESFDDPEAPRKDGATRPKINPAMLATGDSFFDGRMIQRVGIHLLGLILFVITAGLGFPWATCMVYRWETNHTIVQGHRLKFTGKGIQLLGRFLLWLLLIVFTLGIILLWIQIFLKKWKVKHTIFAD